MLPIGIEPHQPQQKTFFKVAKCLMIREWTRPWEKWLLLYFQLSSIYRKSWSLPNVSQIVSVKTISSNTVTGSLPTHCQASVSKRADTISWSVKVRTPPLTSPKSILADRRYLTCGGRWKRIDWKNHCPVYWERMAGLDLLEKSTRSTKGEFLAPELGKQGTRNQRECSYCLCNIQVNTGHTMSPSLWIM